MATRIVSYTVRPDAAEENGQRILQVFAELEACHPSGLRYTVLRDGQRFLHIATSPLQISPLLSLPSFLRFREGVPGRCLEQPVTRDAVLLGDFGALSL